MAINALVKIKDGKGDEKLVSFGVGDKVRVVQRIKEKDSERDQAFEGTVIKIKGMGDRKTFTVRRIGVQNIGIEKIFPLNLPTISSIEVVRKGLRGVRRAKLYYIRDKSRKEIEKIYSRSAKREAAKLAKKSKKASKK